MFNNIYKDKKVFITGHTGFKGSWLVFWLKNIGAEVLGYSLEPPTKPNHYELLNLDIYSVIGDIRDRDKLFSVVKDFKPDIVFHLAAQPLVRYSYKNPLETLETNIIGTANVFEACKNAETIKAIVNITSDKCYENKEWVWGYRENDPMGGYDPYSASKGCSELITSSYRNSFFNPKDYGKKHNTLLASVRAGNVIGGGDWSEDRLIPDIVKATEQKKKVFIRNPKATRPWQHVLEPLSGYLLIGQKLLEGKKEFADGWNFGPNDENIISVEEIVKLSKKYWDEIYYEINTDLLDLHEAMLLKLDCSKAHYYLNWKPIWDIDKTLEKTISWYKHFYTNKEILTNQDLEEYIKDAQNKGAVWAK